MKRHMKKEQGVGLIEVLVTLLILSTTLIALSALQTRSLQFNQGAYFRSQANALAYDMLDRIRVNDALPASNVAPKPVREALSAYTMAETLASAATAATSPLSAADRYQWLRSITWTELNSSGLADEDASKFIYEARI